LENLGLVFGYGQHWFEKDDGDKEDDNSWIVGAHYDFKTGTRIRGAASKQIRFPSIRQLYDPDDGNPNLDTENVQNYELGIEQRLPWNSWVGVVGFYSDAEDFIKRDDLTDVQENVEELRYRGVEVTAQTFPLKNLFLGLGYTYLDVEDKSPGAVYDEPEYNPRHKFTLEGKYRFAIGFSIYANWIYVGRQYHDSNDDPPLRRKLNDYQLFNLKLEQELLRGALVLYAGVDNFFDKNYETSYGFPQSGQFLYGGVRYRF
jgi:outer membrane cobalamin receptor